MFNDSSYDNFTMIAHSKCDHEPENPWCGWDSSGRIMELICLTIISLVGTAGNLLVIVSILVEKRAHKHGNMFIINLAVADLMVTGIFIPTCIAHVLERENALSAVACKAMGYLATSSCICSMCNLTFIAMDRYCAIVRKPLHDALFSPRKAKIFILFTWLWSNVVVLPTVFGWSDLIYDAKMMACSWDDTKSETYNILLMVLAVILPLIIISFCYLKLFKSVRYRSRTMKVLCVNGCSKQKQLKWSENFIRREINLLKTLITTVCVFVLCWTPYCLCILIDSKGVNYQLKKIVGRLAISSSAVNFIIYGTMNRVYRRGYLNLFFCAHCKSTKKHRVDSVETSSIQTANSRRQSCVLEPVRTQSSQKCAYSEVRETKFSVTQEFTGLKYGRYVKNFVEEANVASPNKKKQFEVFAA